MGRKVAIKSFDKYVLVSISGEAGLPQEIQSVLTEAVEEASDGDRDIILHRELPVKLRARVADFYYFAELLAKLSFRNKLALVFPEEMLSGSLAFFETASKNRGINIKLFSELPEALEWIKRVDP